MSEPAAPPPSPAPDADEQERQEHRGGGPAKVLLLIEAVLAVLGAAFMLLWVLKADPQTGARELEFGEAMAVAAFLAVAVWALVCWHRLRRGHPNAAIVYGALTTAFFLLSLFDPTADLLMPLVMQLAILVSAWQARSPRRERAVADVSE